MERNESAFSLSVNQFKESLNYSNDLSDQVIKQVESIQQRLNHIKAENQYWNKI